MNQQINEGRQIENFPVDLRFDVNAQSSERRSGAPDMKTRALTTSSWVMKHQHVVEVNHLTRFFFLDGFDMLTESAFGQSPVRKRV